MNPHRQHVLMKYGTVADKQGVKYYMNRLGLYLDNLENDFIEEETITNLILKAKGKFTLLTHLSDIVEKGVSRGPLDVYRALVGQPHLPATGADPRSVLTLCSEITRHLLVMSNPDWNGGVNLNLLLSTDETKANHYLATMYYVEQLWIRFDLVQWHLVDGILWDLENP